MSSRVCFALLIATALVASPAAAGPARDTNESRVTELDVIITYDNGVRGQRTVPVSDTWGPLYSVDPPEGDEWLWLAAWRQGARYVVHLSHPVPSVAIQNYNRSWPGPSTSVVFKGGRWKVRRGLGGLHIIHHLDDFAQPGSCGGSTLTLPTMLGRGRSAHIFDMGSIVHVEVKACAPTATPRDGDT